MYMCTVYNIYIYNVYIYIQPYIHVIYFVGTHMYYMFFGWVSHLPVRPCDAHLDWIPSNGANPLTHRFFLGTWWFIQLDTEVNCCHKPNENYRLPSGKLR